MADRRQGEDSLQTDRSTVRRKRDRGRYERTVVEAILDDGLVCHVAFSADDAPVLQPMAYARIGEDLYLHGASGNRMLRTLADGAPAAVCVTILDGIVYARSAFHHSMNYRSVVLFGSGALVTDADELTAAAMALVAHLTPGREAEARTPSAAELRATTIIRFPIDEGSAKIRSGPPIDDEDDVALPIWAGELPITLAAGTPVASPNLRAGIPTPSYLADALVRPKRRP
jgi:hypothetical protein